MEIPGQISAEIDIVKSESPDNGPRTDKPNHKRALARAEKL
jgi:hypothetical protein